MKLHIKEEHSEKYTDGVVNFSVPYSVTSLDEYNKEQFDSLIDWCNDYLSGYELDAYVQTTRHYQNELSVFYEIEDLETTTHKEVNATICEAIENFFEEASNDKEFENFFKEELDAEKFEDLLDRLKNDFSSGYRDTDDETYFDIDLEDRFVASVDLENGVGYFYWNPDGNSVSVGPEFDVTTEEGYKAFTDMIWDVLDNDYTLYADGLKTIGFEEISNNVYQRVETNKFSNDVETITATFDFNDWTGEVIHTWKENTDYDEINEFENFFDFCENAEIIR